MEILDNVPLAPFTTLGVGGPARRFARARSYEDVIELLSAADVTGDAVFILGGGSNILVSDEGFDGLVVKLELLGIDFEDDGDRVIVTAGAGEDWDSFVAGCVKRDLAGIECLSGIPGTLGGTPVQNVGAYGQDVSESIASVQCFDRLNRALVDLSASECGFAYRSSIFNTTELNRYIVLSVVYSLLKKGRANVEYKDLQERFADRDPTLAEVRSAVLSIRRAKSMVIDAADPNSRSAGSFFKNPIVTISAADSIADKLGVERVPQFAAGVGQVKIPAAWLIERAGFQKGFVLGNAGISQNHSLAIINRGGATAREIIALKDLIQRSVFDKFGISLQPEPIIVGF